MSLDTPPQIEVIHHPEFSPRFLRAFLKFCERGSDEALDLYQNFFISGRDFNNEFLPQVSEKLLEVNIGINVRAFMHKSERWRIMSGSGSMPNADSEPASPAEAAILGFAEEEITKHLQTFFANQPPELLAEIEKINLGS